MNSVEALGTIKGYTEPSQVGNGLKGVETRPYCLKLLLAMTMKAHERTPSNWMMIWSELTGNSKNSEINSSEDNSDVNLQKIHGMILADEGINKTLCGKTVMSCYN